MKIDLDLRNDEHFEYNINTGYIYSNLCMNWEKFPRELFKQVEWELENILWQKKKITVPYSEEMRDYLNNQRVKLDFQREFVENPEHSPSMDFFLQPVKDSYAVISYNENCLLRYGQDCQFDYFFALKLAVIDLMVIPELLEYQLAANFNLDAKKYKTFLQTLLIKYKVLFHEGSITETVNNFIVELNSSITDYMEMDKPTLPIQKDNSDNLLEEDTKKNTIRQQVMAIHLLFQAFDCMNNDATQRARFIQFLTDKELGAKSIHRTSIYDVTKQPFAVSDKKLIDDLDKIRPYFVDLGLTQVVKLIDEMLNKANK